MQQLQITYQSTIYTKACMLCLGLLAALVLCAQDPAARYEIDAKRAGLYSDDKEALPRGREFVRLDSTYYVGWYYQGSYLFDRSADEAGFRKSAPLLRRAFDLLEGEFTPVLQTIFDRTENYMKHYRVYADYMELAMHLRECYEYLNKPDSAIWIIERVELKNFPRDHAGLMFGNKAWIIYRNRYYTRSQYAFLKNTVEENIDYALETCYRGFAHIEKNMPQMSQWYGPWQLQMDYQYIYHYLAMLHSYKYQYDSAEYYYNKMSEFGSISWNNYGSLKHEMGEIEAAQQLYSLDKYGLANDKRLREPFYYLPTLSIYAGNTMEAMSIAKEAISASLSYPGFGWYNIALARGYLYNGQLDSADATLSKAANFKEVHIGTTLTQVQYDFTINLLRLVWYKKSIAQVKFADKGWWYKPTQWYKLAVLASKKYMHQYALASQLSENPERKRILYDLFCGESTVMFDEIYAVMETFGDRYFTQLMREKAADDPRPNVQRYFELMESRLLVARGKHGDAEKLLTQLLERTPYDQVHEKLFRARVLQALLQVQGKGEQRQAWAAEWMETYPQLIPFSGQKVEVGLQLDNTAPEDKLLQEVAGNIQQLHVDWVSSSTNGVPQATIRLKKTGSKYEAEIEVYTAAGKPLVTQEKFLFTSASQVALEIGLRVFGKAGAIELETAP